MKCFQFCRFCNCPPINASQRSSIRQPEPTTDRHMNCLTDPVTQRRRHCSHSKWKSISLFLTEQYKVLPFGKVNFNGLFFFAFIDRDAWGQREGDGMCFLGYAYIQEPECPAINCHHCWQTLSARRQACGGIELVWQNKRDFVRNECKQTLYWQPDTI